MAVNKELWQKEIEEQLFKTNAFLDTFKNADEYVVGGRIVHIPQSGGASTVVKNRSSFPATVSERTDTDVTYLLDEYTTNPRRVSNMDEVELSYNKMSSIITEDTGIIMETAGDNILYDVSKDVPAGSKIATSGAASVATSSGATGNRKILTEADIRKARILLNKQNVPKADRFMLLTEDMYDHLMSDNSLKYAFQTVVDLEMGEMKQLYGFKLMSRSTVLRVDGSQVLKAVGAADATTDAEAGLFYQRNALERAIGDIGVYDDTKNPLYYSDIISFLLRAAGRKRRADNKGYGIIYRAAAA